jgi:oxalate decarboxylase/phosphoglucose isomerase-like protein (cupin superfamily)
MSSSTIARYIIAGLSAAATVSAFPASQSSWAAPSPAPSSNSAPSFTLASITQPSPPPPPADTAAAAAAAASIAALAKTVAADVTNIDRFNSLITVNGAGTELLRDDALAERLVFDFGAHAVAGAGGLGGRLALATADNFPVLVDQGLATAVAFLEPCGMNSPHIHPRATEFLTLVQGRLQTGFMLENGFVPGAAAAESHQRLTTQVSANLTAFQSTVFPQGSIHFQFNDYCEPATFVSTLNSADPGTSQIAQNFFFLDDRVVDVALGGPVRVDGGNLDRLRDSLPPNLVRAMDGCLARCGRT